MSLDEIQCYLPLGILTFRLKTSEIITIRLTGWISGRIVSLQPDPDIQKLLSNGTGHGSGYPKRFYRYFEDSDLRKKLHIAQSFIYYFQKHLFSFLYPDSESVDGVIPAPYCNLIPLLNC